jgi:hypothetical protein
MSKTPTRIQTSMRFKPETLAILDHHAAERAIPRTYLLETIIDQWNSEQSDLTTRVKNLENAVSLLVSLKSA